MHPNFVRELVKTIVNIVRPYIRPAIESLFKLINKNIGQILKYLAALLVGGGISGLLVSKYKDKVYHELLKNHDKETAKKLTKEFNKKLKEVVKKYKGDKEKLIAVITKLCERFNIPPELILNDVNM